LHWFEPDEEALAQAMREMVEQHATWQEHAGHASQRIRATHAWDAVTAQYLERILALTGSESESRLHQ
jgi:glycosyltransferase involved in cell wall biosynthesis